MKTKILHQIIEIRHQGITLYLEHDTEKNMVKILNAKDNLEFVFKNKLSTKNMDRWKNVGRAISKVAELAKDILEDE